MEKYYKDIIEYFKQVKAPLTTDDISKKFSIIPVDQVESILDEMWEQDLLCRMESFCSILYTLEE